MKRVLALICALLLIMGYAICESQVSPQESITEIVETIEEPTIEESVIEESEPQVEEVIEEFPAEEAPVEELMTESTEEIVEPIEIQVEEPVEESAEEIIEEPIEETVVEQIEETVVEEPIIEEPIEEPVIEQPVEEPQEETIVIISSESEQTQEGEVTSNIVEFEEDDWGEIVVELPREVYISFIQEPQYFGDTVVLVATLVNFKKTDRYTISWEYSVNGEEWISIEGENERTYTFVINHENYLYAYRVAIEMEE